MLYVYFAGSNKFEPEPFAWLNQPQLENEDGCKVLTQFKTVESDDSLSSDPPNDTIKAIKADVHVQSSQPSIRSSASRLQQTTASVTTTSTGGTPPISPHILGRISFKNSLKTIFGSQA